MSGRRFGWLGFGLVSSAGAGLLALSAMMNAGFAYGEPVPTGSGFPNDDVVYAELMGGSGTPIPQLGGIPPGTYMPDVFNHYLTHSFPHLNFDAPCPAAPCDVNGLFTPQGLYPLTGVKDLPLDVSVSRGETILDQAINGQLAANPTEPVGVFGYSQSAIISSLTMTDLATQTTPVSPDLVNFVLLGNPMNPNGGIFARFPDLLLPSLGLDFYGATPDDLYPTQLYSLEYDGFADFPTYPINFLADLNAIVGIYYVHTAYAGLDPTDLPAGYELHHLTNVVPPTMTDYYMISIPDLPLLDPLRDYLPIIGNPLADLLQPDLTALVNLGYGDPDFGWSTSAPNVPTQFGLFPSLSDFEKLFPLLVAGTQQGITDFIGDFAGSGPNPVSLAALMTAAVDGSGSGLSSLLSDPAAALAALTNPADALGAINNIVNAFTSAVAAGYATLLPTADILNAILTSGPLYDANLFAAGIEQLLGGNPMGLLNAFGDPIAADTALLTLAGGFELVVGLNAIASTAGGLTSPIP